MFLSDRMAALLDLVRKLIGYRKELAATLDQRAAANPYFAVLTFGTNNLALILARITRGLQRAAALEARLVRACGRARPEHRARPQRPLTPTSPAPTGTPRIAPPAAPRVNTPHAEMPAEEQIIADRRRPIGAVIADICRDLAIRPSHPLWREIQSAINSHGGSYIRLLKHALTTYYQLAGELIAPPQPASPLVPSSALASTGPPRAKPQT
jgi:hypothetical protein